MPRHNHGHPRSDGENPFVVLAVVAAAFGLLFLGFYLASPERAPVARSATRIEVTPEHGLHP